MIGFKIFDGFGRKNSWRINGEGEGSVVIHPHPPKDEVKTAIPFRQFFTDDGSATGTTNMRVDGSTNNVDFFIQAIATRDIYIKTISVLIADVNATLDKFGTLTALTNGVEFKWVSAELGTVTIAAALKTNFAFVRLALGDPAFGTGANAFQAANIAGNSEGYLPVIDLAKVFGPPWGLRLKKGTLDSLRFTIKDNVTTIDGFDIIGYGIQF